MDLKGIYSDILFSVLNEKIEYSEMYSLIEVPKHSHLGDLAFPCFQLSKIERTSPAILSKNIASQLHSPYLERAEAVGPYVNVFLNKEKISKDIIDAVMHEGANYGSHSFGNGETIVLDLSSPNIAKPFSMGHLRSTVIGNAVSLIAKKCAYKPVKINYIGDWGTQFGKLIVAFKKWGDIEQVRQNPIQELFVLYKKFHEEAEMYPELEAEGRRAFKLLEEGDEEITSLWRWFRDESLEAFKAIYDLLGISFDSYHGEAFFNDKMDEVVELLKDKQLLEHSEGAEVVMLPEHNLPPCLIKKSDGATLYATRDLAAALYRQREYSFNQALYVVGQEQTIHFKQVYAVLEKLGYEWAKHLYHIPFGLYLKEGKKMSTRKGRVILLEEVLTKAIEIAKQNIEEKNPHLENSEEVAKAVGIGAVIFHDLKNDRLNDIEFSLEHMLTFEGETGPYVQYTHARAQSILRKANVPFSELKFDGLHDEDSWDVVKLLQNFPDVIKRSHRQYSPSVLAKYLVDLAQSFNKYYGKVRILEEDQEKINRLAFVHSVSTVLREGLSLLGIKAPEEM